MYQGDDNDTHKEDINTLRFYVSKAQGEAIKNLVRSGYTLEGAVAKVLKLPVERLQRSFMLEFLDK